MNQNSKVPLSSFISYRKGKPARKTFAQNGRYLPILTPEYLRNNGGNKMAVVTDNLVLVDDGELILLWDGSNAGEFFRAKQGILASTMVALDFNANEFGADYLYYSLKHFEPYLKVQTRGSGIPHVDKEILLSHQIFKPLRPEQSKIAEVLTAVDQAITQTETLIAKYQRIKTGLMQDLLTRGIDENGNLRDPATHEFKEVEGYSRMPKDWQYVLLENVCRTPLRDFGSFSMTNLITFLDSGVPFIKSEMIKDAYLNTDSMFFISEEVHQLLHKSWVYPGNILYSKIGSALGKAVVYDGSFGICNSNAAVAKIDVDETIASRNFIAYLLNSPETLERIKKKIVSLLPRLNLTDISTFEIPLPPLQEQYQIVSILEAQDSCINTEEMYLAKLEEIKRGLMQDLLTGKVSVASLLENNGN